MHESQVILSQKLIVVDNNFIISRFVFYLVYVDK